MSFYDNYIALCNRVRKTPSAVALEIGLSKPAVNRWKKGGVPTDATVAKVANYFHVPVEALVNGSPNLENRGISFMLEDELANPSDIKKEPTVDDDELSESHKALIEFAKTVPEDKAEMILRIMKSIVEVD